MDDWRDSKVQKISEDQLQTTLRIKKECNARAQRIVESLLEPCITEDDFLEKIRYINQCHYNDVVEERHILELCSYPLCSQEVYDVPTQVYHISTTTNKVYDITDRKKYCSAHCYKASEYIKLQMLTTPLWMRHQETMPQFQLLKKM